MGFISNRKRKVFYYKNIERQFASEIVEIFEEKLDELNVTLPGIAKNKDEQSARIKSKTRNELMSFK